MRDGRGYIATVFSKDAVLGQETGNNTIKLRPIDILVFAGMQCHDPVWKDS